MTKETKYTYIIENKQKVNGKRETEEKKRQKNKKLNE